MESERKNHYIERIECVYIEQSYVLDVDETYVRSINRDLEAYEDKDGSKIQITYDDLLDVIEHNDNEYLDADVFLKGRSGGETLRSILEFYINEDLWDAPTTVLDSETVDVKDTYY